MIRFLVLGFALLCSSSFAQPIVPARNAELAEILSFEKGETDQLPNGWSSGTRDSVGFDSATVYRGSGALRLHLPEAKPGAGGSVVLLRLPVDFAGSKIELRGFMKTEDVSEFAGLWLRLDAEPGVTVGFDNMARQQLKGTRDWEEYTITVPIDPKAKFLYAGVLLTGSGKAWADDLQLLVDGKPIWELPVAEPALTALDKDKEFERGSKVVAPSLTPIQITNLAALAKAWGFLKYHHPRVTAGEYHWDHELFRIMPVVLAAPDREALVGSLVGWIDRLGGDSLSAEEEIATDVHLAPVNVWRRDPILSDPRIASKLEAFRADQTVRKSQYFVSLAAGVGNPQFQHEPSYPQIAFPDHGYQLLALFRYWNIVQYWFPYRDLVEGDWDDVLTEFIPRIGLAPDNETYKRELLAFTARIADTHANLWSSLSSRPPTGEGQLPVVIRMVANQPVVSAVVPIEGAITPAFQPGDMVTAIDRVPVAELFRAWTPYYAASNQAKRLLDIGRSMFIGPVGPVTVEVRRGQEVLTIEAERLPMRNIPREGMRRWHDLPGPAFRLLSPEVAYLKLSGVKISDIPKYLKQAAGTKGWIIDIRNYPSAFVVFALGQHLVREPTPFARFTVGSLAHPGAFSYGPPVQLRPADPHYSGKVVVLVDEVSLSQAEYTAMAFRVAPGALVVGSTTAGADGNVSNFNLPGGVRTGISGIGVFYPDKRPTQRIGIVPDIEAKPTVAGIREGRDEALEEGIRQILGPDASTDMIHELIPKDI
jgi:hypothetical protein